MHRVLLWHAGAGQCEARIKLGSLIPGGFGAGLTLPQQGSPSRTGWHDREDAESVCIRRGLAVSQLDQPGVAWKVYDECVFVARVSVQEQQEDEVAKWPNCNSRWTDAEGGHAHTFSSWACTGRHLQACKPTLPCPLCLMSLLLAPRLHKSTQRPACSCVA